MILNMGINQDQRENCSKIKLGDGSWQKERFKLTPENMELCGRWNLLARIL